MRTFFKFLGKYRISAGMAVGFMLIELFAELLQPYLISIIIDKGIARQDLSVVWLWGGVLALAALAAFVCGILSSFVSAHASQSLGYDVREALYSKVQGMAYAAFNRFATSSLITRLTNDATQLQDVVFMGLRFFLRMPLLVVGSMIMALTVDASLGLLLVVTVPVLVLFVIWVMRKASALFRRVQARLDTLNGVMQENFTGMRLIRIFVRRKVEGERFDRRGRELMNSSVSAMQLTEFTQPFILLLMNAGIIAVLWFGHQEIDTGSASMGQVVAIVNYSLRTAVAMSMLGSIIMTVSRARASAQRVEEVLFTEEKDALATGGDASAATALDGDLAFENVTFRYPDAGAPSLEDVTFGVRAGQTAAIMGATGSGKTTLMQLIIRFYEPDSGVVRVGGEDVREVDLGTLRGSIGYVPQEALLFTGTIRDNIAWGKEDATMEEIVEAAESAQIHETIMKFPDGYDTQLGQRGVNLSGGQKQRLSIARALIRKPAILLLDDSMSALDTRTEAAVMQALGRLSGTTTLLITQKISAASKADLIILLDDGRMLAQGSHGQLLATESLYRAIYESQSGEEAAAHATDMASYK
ncbi:ABC transporter ATP-binding protein [Cohnella panacarvi]|uniref:ABC transporter ATP-binding protein n=1 Tax=Cohnella panacarvi TaxID=400776 RepID=UPI000478D02A|nr:ABC transporter ATP-binding protein [Cohnella panacarvi]